jgi:hypothetical protein
MGMWSSRHGKFSKKDPNHGLLGKKIKNYLSRNWARFVHWCCKVGLCNLDKCKCKCHRK